MVWYQAMHCDSLRPSAVFAVTPRNRVSMIFVPRTISLLVEAFCQVIIIHLQLYRSIGLHQNQKLL